MRKWWEEAAEKLQRANKATLFDLKKNERLCAVCLVKRAYPFPEVAINDKAIGWSVPVNYPSTAYMGAVDWLIYVLRACKADNGVKREVEDLIDAAKAAGVPKAERATRIKGITEAGQESTLDDWEYLADLDGGAFFESVIENQDEFEVREEPGSADSSINRKALRDALRALHKELGRMREKQPLAGGDGAPAVVKATPFYAHLLMDGDNMGKLLSDNKGKQSQISKALAEFTTRVPKIVADHNGRLIYAGGDDVFALLPVDKAIDCAKACRQAYMDAFNSLGSPLAQEFTISAAIEYAHIHTALGVVVRDAHALLDDYAKEQCNRDGLACRVWKRGGPVLVWAQPWEVVLSSTGSTLVEEVRTLFQNNSNDPARLSSKFFYKARDLFNILEPQRGTAVAPGSEQKLLVAEYLATREHRWNPNWSQQDILLEAGKRIDRFLTLCRSHERVPGSIPKPGRLTADGALLVRFLAQKEV